MDENSGQEVFKVIKKNGNLNIYISMTTRQTPSTALWAEIVLSTAVSKVKTELSSSTTVAFTSESSLQHLGCPDKDKQKQTHG